ATVGSIHIIRRLHVDHQTTAGQGRQWRPERWKCNRAHTSPFDTRSSFAWRPSATLPTKSSVLGGSVEARGHQWALLGELESAQVERVLASGRPRRFARREVVWHEGDRADTVHLIRSGRIAVRALTVLGEVATIAVLGAGEAAGLIAVHGTDPYHTSGAVA